MVRIITMAGAFTASLALAGCGDNIREQALIGGGGGAAAALVLSGDPLTGLVLGALGNVAVCQAGAARC
ncbi:MAG: hypothetical protein AAFR35_10705 [Pseudomonadota bacterium]